MDNNEVTELFDKVLMLKIFARRLGEITLLEVLLSLIYTAMCVGEFFPQTRTACSLWSAIFVTLFILINSYMHRGLCYALGEADMYYKTSYASHIAFAVINIIMYFLLGNGKYTWLFSITKFAQFFGNQRISTFSSILIFHTIMMVVIAIAPIGIKMTHKNKKNGHAKTA